MDRLPPEILFEILSLTARNSLDDLLALSQTFSRTYSVYQTCSTALYKVVISEAEKAGSFRTDLAVTLALLSERGESVVMEELDRTFELVRRNEPGLGIEVESMFKAIRYWPYILSNAEVATNFPASWRVGDLERYGPEALTYLRTLHSFVFIFTHLLQTSAPPPPPCEFLLLTPSTLLKALQIHLLTSRPTLAIRQAHPLLDATILLEIRYLIESSLLNLRTSLFNLRRTLTYADSPLKVGDPMVPAEDYYLLLTPFDTTPTTSYPVYRIQRKWMDGNSEGDGFVRRLARFMNWSERLGLVGEGRSRWAGMETVRRMMVREVEGLVGEGVMEVYVHPSGKDWVGVSEVDTRERYDIW